jgi:hypothetical protein
VDAHRIFYFGMWRFGELQKQSGQQQVSAVNPPLRGKSQSIFQSF